MGETVDSSSTVSYTVKELFEGMTSRFDKQDGVLEELRTRLDTMPTTEDVSDIHRRLDGHDTRIRVMEEKELVDEESRASRRKLWSVAGTAGGIIAVLASAVISRGHW